MQGPQPRLSPARLIAACEAHHGDLPHRRAVVEDHATGLRLSRTLRLRGWQCTELELMVLRHAPDRPPRPGVALVVDAERFAAVEAATDAELLPVGGDVIAELRVARERLRAVHPRTRRIVATDEGADVAHATLFADGRTAQVEDVVTLGAHRGRGLARAAVGLACVEAADHELTFLNAERADWPRALYAKLGFVRAGGSWVMTSGG